MRICMHTVRVKAICTHIYTCINMDMDSNNEPKYKHCPHYPLQGKIFSMNPKTKLTTQFQWFSQLPPLVQTSKLRINVPGLNVQSHWELLLTCFTSCHREEKKMQTHEHTIMVWLEVRLSVCPCLLLGGEGNVFRKGKNSMISFFAVERGAGKKGGVIDFTSVGSGGILGFSVRGKCLFTYTTFPVYSEHKSEVCGCEFTIGIRHHVVFKICINDWLCKYLALLSSHLFPVARLCQGNVFLSLKHSILYLTANQMVSIKHHNDMNPSALCIQRI